MAESSEKITKSRILVYSFIQSSIQWLCAEHWFGGTKVNRQGTKIIFDLEAEARLRD